MPAQTALARSASAPDSTQTRTRRSHHEPFSLPLEGDGLLREVDACRALACGRSTLWRLARGGRLHPVKLGGMTRWKISELRALLNG